jgi:CheY-like chemotaxis protein
MTVQALVIDDNSNNRSVLAELLTWQGVTCELLDGADALADALAVQTPDLIFLDLEMPGLNGYQILEWLRSDERTTHIPVVAYTVHVSEINMARRLGFQGFLGKPLSVEKFPNQLARILRGEPVWEIP